MSGSGSTRIGRLVGLATAIIVIGGGVAYAASLSVTSQKVTTFTAAGPTTTSTTVQLDTTAPALVSLQMFETGTADGLVDRVVATFDEALASYTAGTTPWVLTGVPSSRTLSTVTVVPGGTTAVLELTGGNGVKNTASGSFSVALTPTATGVRDSAGNMSTFTSAVADKAGPVPVSLLISDKGGGNTPGKPEKADDIRVVFSEQILPTTICSKWTGSDIQSSSTSDILLDIKNQVPSDVVAVRNATSGTSAPCAALLKFGTISLGSTAFVPADVSFGGGSGSNGTTIAWNPTTFALSAELGVVSAGASPGTVGSTTATYTPDPAVTDSAGNSAAGTALSTKVQF